MSSLSGKVALITGGSKGIGAAIAKNLATRGATVVINYSSDSSSADAVLSSLTSLAPNSNPSSIKADVGSVSDCQRLIKETVDKYKKIDVLILNAGWMPNADLASTTEETFERCYAINVKGPFFLAQAAVPHMPTDGSGRIIFFSTSLTVATGVTPNYTLYVSTKGAVEQLTRALSKDLGRKGIAVNCVSPGPTGTDLFFHGKSEAIIKTIASFSPTNRIGKPEEVAEVVGFLSGPEGGWVMGQNWRANGGFA